MENLNFDGILTIRMNGELIYVNPKLLEPNEDNSSRLSSKEYILYVSKQK